MDKLTKVFLFGILILALFAIYLAPLSGKPPAQMADKAKELDQQSHNKEELIKSVYKFINQSYTSPIRQYLKEPSKIFVKDIKKIWDMQGGYLPSNTQNEMAKQMLLLTGKFKQEDFIAVQGWCEISPHSYLTVKTENQTFVIDSWFADNGGRFNCYTFRPCGATQIRCFN